MKRKMLRNIICFLFLIVPFSISAKMGGISDYLIEATILDNGDIHVKEMFLLEGKYNGYERKIKYFNSDSLIFDGTKESFSGSSIYNGDGIELLQIKSIEVNEQLDFKHMNNDEEPFIKVEDATPGDSGKYTITQVYGGETYKIFNPSGVVNEAFYIEYLLKNMVVVHNDIAELGWQIFNDEQTEIIDSLRLHINLPSNKNEIRVWGHGPLTGEVDIINKNKIVYNVDDLRARTPIDVRLLFDKEAVLNCSKHTNVDAFNKILAIEGRLAEAANLERETALKEIQKQKRISFLFDFLKMVWIILLGVIIYHVYNKHDKEYKSSFKTKYFRDFPANYGPANVSYLINKKIGPNEMSASILDLIARKVINYNEISKNKYVLSIEDSYNKDDLTEAEMILIDFIFNDIGENNVVTIDKINNFARKHHDEFLNNYNDWKYAATFEAKGKKFYEEKTNVKAKAILFSIIGLLLTLFTIQFTNSKILNPLIIVLSTVSMIYFALFNKRTKEGQDDYLKWIGLKRFLNDFGKFEARELPHVELWEKYLVYAVVFGIAKKLSKVMQLKFNEMPQNTYTMTDYVFDITRFKMLNNLNYNLNKEVNKAINNAMSKQAISESRSSSLGGFGGGFSGGSGGSFGGGGGGGRF